MFINTYIAPSLRITSSTTSKLAFATICITCLSPPPRAAAAAAPPTPRLYAGEVAPESAFRVPANAEVDQDGKFEASG